MNRQGRVLVVDDNIEWCKALVEILQDAGFYASSVCTMVEALEILDNTFYHLLVLDIHLSDDGSSDLSGIDLLIELNKRNLSRAIEVIMLSGYGTREIIRKAFKEYQVADFLYKDDFGEEAFLENVHRVFSETMETNLALSIHWQNIRGPEQVVLNLAIDDIPVKRSTPLQAQIAVELDNLLCCLFYQASSILVRPLVAGLSGTGILLIKPFYTNGGGHEVIMKFGDFHKINEEYRKFTEYVKPFLGSSHNTIALDLRRTMHLAGIIYSLLGTSNDQLVDFSEFYRRADLSQIKDALSRLFWDTCSAWYANRGRLEPINLTADYKRLFSFSSEKLEHVLSNEMGKVVQGKQKLHFQHLSSNRVYTNPLTMIDEFSLICSTYSCVTHGDLNPNNLLIDSTGNTWLIDFQEIAPGHILRDVAMLDSAIRFQLLSAEEASLEERLIMEEVLCSINRFSQVDQLGPRFSTQNPALSKAFETVVHLRRLAYKLMEQSPTDDISEYYIALLYNALNTLRFSSLQLGQREHALLCASLLADRLGLGS